VISCSNKTESLHAIGVRAWEEMDDRDQIWDPSFENAIFRTKNCDFKSHINYGGTK
jgi:hypothetical protein